jgi:hypothetical protein
MAGRLARVFRGGEIKAMADPTPGTVEVTTASFPGFGSEYCSYQLFGVLHVPGLAPTPVELNGTALVAKWPRPGQTLPVTADRSDPTKVVVEWDQVMTGAQLAAAAALREQTNLDLDVLALARERAQDASTTAPACQAGAQPSPAHVAEVQGTVIAATPVPATADVAPPGGTWDLTVRTAERTVLVRATFQTPAVRQTVTTVGTTVVVVPDPADPDVGTLVTN